MTATVASNLKVLTLNCWGVPVPLVCKKRHERMIAIGEEVAKSDYDIAVFQEIWSKGDYQILKSKIGKTLPYSHYFYSGIIGSGLCLFSKYPIQETLFHMYALNGYAHKVQHGDWFGGKGVGLAKIDFNGFTLYVYVTHIHAEYNREHDEYSAHRSSQAFDLGQFIKYTSSDADLVLACGDFNFEPVDLGYKLIRTNCSLRDCWLDKLHTTSSDPEGNTCDCPGNSFSSRATKAKYPNGKRIDYILYKSGKDVWVDIKDCSVAMGAVPGKDFSFSDHEGVTACISMERRQGAVAPKSEEELSPLLQESLSEIDKGLKKTRTDHRFFLLFAVVSLLLAYLISIIHIPYPLDFFVTFFELVLVMATGYGVIQTFIMIRCEIHSLEAARDDIKHKLQSL